MDTKALRHKILDLAIRGKLVPQDPNDEPASVLLERICAEKERLIAEGKIKRPQKAKSSSSESHYQKFTAPFEIPDSWEWVRLDDIAQSNIGLTYKSTDISKDGIPVYRSNNIQNSSICKDDIVRVNSEILSNQFLHEGDLLICARNGSRRLIGKNAIIQKLDEPTSFGAFMAVCRSAYNSWIHILLNTRYFDRYLDASNSTAINQVTQKMLLDFTIPFPPIREQNRIISILSMWFKILDDMDKKSEDLKTTISNTKSKILELAMQGKLVPQDPNDEPAADMLRRFNPKARIITDNPHYPIVPKSWIYTPLSSLADIKSAKRVMKSDWKNCGIPFYRTREIVRLSKDGYVDNELFISQNLYDEYKEKYGVPIAGDIMLTAVGTIGDTYIVTPKDVFYYKDASVLCLHPRTIIYSDFLSILFSVPFLQKQMKNNSKGTTVDTITIEKASTYICPLPPLEEQKRIVCKIEEMYSILDEIETSLQS